MGTAIQERRRQIMKEADTVLHMYMDKKEIKAIAEAEVELSEIFASLNTTSCPNCKSCCCKGCADRVGYLFDRGSGSRHFPTMIIRLMKECNFTWDKGFLGDAGCKLPRWLRSRTCLRHTCRALYGTMSGREADKLDKRISECVDIIQFYLFRFF